MKLWTLCLLTMAASLSACAADPTWERLRPPSSMVNEANGCPAYTIDDAAPLSQWKKVGEFWDQDACTGTPFQVAQIKGQMELSRETVERKARKGDPDSIKTVKCWTDRDYLSWTAPASSALVGHEWDAIPYACVEKGDPRLTAANSADRSPQVAGQ